MGSPHDRLGVVLETAMIALMHDGSSVALGFVPPIPSSRPHVGSTLIAWKHANSPAPRRELAVTHTWMGARSDAIEASELALSRSTRREGESLSL